MYSYNLHLDMKRIRILFVTNNKDDKSIKGQSDNFWGGGV